MKWWRRWQCLPGVRCRFFPRLQTEMQCELKTWPAQTPVWSCWKSSNLHLYPLLPNVLITWDSFMPQHRKATKHKYMRTFYLELQATCDVTMLHCCNTLTCDSGTPHDRRSARHQWICYHDESDWGAWAFLWDVVSWLDVLLEIHGVRSRLHNPSSPSWLWNSTQIYHAKTWSWQH